MNPFGMLVAVMQLAASAYGFWHGDWKQGVVMAAFGVGSAVIATMVK